MPYLNHRDPPPYLPLAGPVADAYSLGHAVFNSDFLAAGTLGAGRRAGLGPLFNEASCDECHNEGAHGRGPEFDGPMPNSMVMQLEALPAAGGVAPLNPADPPGDPVYGHVVSPAAIAGFTPEGQVVIRYHVIQRTYPDGTAWTLRQPEYELTHLNYGPLTREVCAQAADGTRAVWPWTAGGGSGQAFHGEWWTLWLAGCRAVDQGSDHSGPCA
ncbi:MAG: hypothetical protein WDM77_00095 [Steroidobacteraceae bacterium]